MTAKTPPSSKIALGIFVATAIYVGYGGPGHSGAATVAGAIFAAICILAIISLPLWGAYLTLLETATLRIGVAIFGAIILLLLSKPFDFARGVVSIGKFFVKP